ncbi:MAG: X-Pro dipeptidyl-peptidase [Bacteroidetes bacterium RIFCSPLOWO2_12_FULL_37_12]|nr:MAG: X-Pro dipeptidyl-peptidase [Bacteroidetes bacterium RIFCSPLOWO2_12_FULL_37_12]
MFLLTLFIATTLYGQPLPDKKLNEDSLYIVGHYDKKEFQIPMRDGIKLFTSVYTPKNKEQKYPVMMFRTPYSVGSYGEKKYLSLLGPSMIFTREGFIFVYQDVRGKFMSEGNFVNMRPQLDVKKTKNDIDESSDTYDTIDWLIKNIPGNNGKVGIWGISYPGFYSAVGSLCGHPALTAVSPQAPISDWWMGDDFHHHGAFFLDAAFDFMFVFDQPRPKPTTEWRNRFEFPVKDGYTFYLDSVGPLKNVNPKYFHDTIAFWNDMIAHPDYDDFWKSRNLLPHFKNVKPAVMTVGGWFDAEDLYGPLKIYSAIEKNNPGIYNALVMGPWSHGGWARTKGDRLGNVTFKNSPDNSTFYQEKIEFPFFMHFLKGKTAVLPEAYIYITGKNEWGQFTTWPPENTEPVTFYLDQNKKLTQNIPANLSTEYDEFVSDPAHPVPYTEEITTHTPKPYMCADQRFAGKRPDVLSYYTEILQDEITLTGPLEVNLNISTAGTDADWIVKLIDVYPDTALQGGYQQLVRGEVFRGRYRKSFEKPEPFVPGEITEIHFEIPDVCHSFMKGHRLMVQIQSSWFPLVDRNPQKFVPNIFNAEETDFIKATHRVYHSSKNLSFIKTKKLKERK